MSLHAHLTVSNGTRIMDLMHFRVLRNLEEPGLEKRVLIPFPTHNSCVIYGS